MTVTTVQPVKKKIVQTQNPRMGLATVTWSVEQDFQKFCGCRRWRSRRWRWNDSGGGSLICRSSELLQMRIRLRNRCVLAMRRPRNNSEPQQHQDMSSRRLSINWTSSVSKSSFTIGLVVCQGTLMSTKRTRMSLGCGDSSMVALHLETG